MSDNIQDATKEFAEHDAALKEEMQIQDDGGGPNNDEEMGMLHEIRAILLNYMDLLEQTPEETPVVEAFIAFEAAMAQLEKP